MHTSIGHSQEVWWIPIGSSSFQAVPQVVHAIQELAAGQRVITELFEIFWPKVFSSIAGHCIITLRKPEDGARCYLLSLVPATKYAKYLIIKKGNLDNHKALHSRKTQSTCARLHEVKDLIHFPKMHQEKLILQL